MWQAISRLLSEQLGEGEIELRNELLPENSEFKPIVVDLRQQSFTIEGLAVGVIRNGDWL